MGLTPLWEVKENSFTKILAVPLVLNVAEANLSERGTGGLSLWQLKCNPLGKALLYH